MAAKIHEFQGNANRTKRDSDRLVNEMCARADAFLKEAVDEICEYGKYVFWEDEEELEKYTSAYFWNLRKQKAMKPLHRLDDYPTERGKVLKEACWLTKIKPR